MNRVATKESRKCNLIQQLEGGCDSRYGERLKTEEVRRGFFFFFFLFVGIRAFVAADFNVHTQMAMCGRSLLVYAPTVMRVDTGPCNSCKIIYSVQTWPFGAV